MTPVFYDTHAHLDYPDFAGDLDEVVQRAAAAGITHTVTIGTHLESSERALALCERFPTVFASVGWHPCEALSAPPNLGARLREIASHPKVVAIGETGLDYRHSPDGKPESSAAQDGRYRARQQEIFRQHLEVAAELGLNCVIHQRDAMDDVLAALRPFADRVRGVFHCFVNNPDDLHRVLELGSLVSYTGIVTFKSADSVRETVAATPLDRLMLETDSPYLSPVPFRGKRCEPARVREIAGVVADVKGVSLEELSRTTCATARDFFRDLPGASS